jgi:TDG/mug DNA glycosylase family protein
LRAGGTALAAKVARLRPHWLAVAGVTAYRTAFGRSGAALGPQQETLGGRRLWVLPNPNLRDLGSAADALTWGDVA